MDMNPKTLLEIVEAEEPECAVPWGCTEPKHRNSEGKQHFQERHSVEDRSDGHGRVGRVGELGS